MAYLVDLEKFYGPLDLLLYLIDRNEMDIYDIQISVITQQYMQYISSRERIDLSNLGDFLSMASYLLNLKSQMLLPRKNQEVQVGEEVVDPREQLVHKLLEYKKYKLVAQLLAERLGEESPGSYFRQTKIAVDVPAKGEIKGSVEALARAFCAVMQSRVPTAESYLLPQGDVNVGEKMEEILYRLEYSGGYLAFAQMLTGAVSRREVVALFLALLELIRLRQVEAFQEQRCGKIDLGLRVAIDNAYAG